MINWNTTKQEHRVINRIADRASALALQFDGEYPTVQCAMDLTAVHANGCPLRLSELLAAEQFDFVHDVFGIRRHLNRKTGELEDFFVPRFAKGQFSKLEAVEAT